MLGSVLPVLARSLLRINHLTLYIQAIALMGEPFNLLLCRTLITGMSLVGWELRITGNLISLVLRQFVATLALQAKVTAISQPR